MSEYKQVDKYGGIDAMRSLIVDTNFTRDEEEEEECEPMLPPEFFSAIKSAFKKSTNPKDLLELLVEFAVFCHKYRKHPYLPEFETHNIHKYLVWCLDPREDIELRQAALCLILNMSHMEALEYFTLLVRQNLPEILCEIAVEAKLELIFPCMRTITNLCCHLPQYQELYFSSIRIEKLLEISFAHPQETGILDYVLMFFRSRSTVLSQFVTEEHVDLYLRLFVNLVGNNAGAIRYVHLEILSFVVTRCTPELINKHVLHDALFTFLEVPNLPPKFATNILSCLSDVLKHIKVTEDMNPTGIVQYLHPDNDIGVRTAAVFCLEGMITSTPEVLPAMCDVGIIPILLDIVVESKAVLKQEAAMCLALVIVTVPECFDELDLVAIFGVLCDVMMAVSDPILTQAVHLLIGKIAAVLGPEAVPAMTEEIDLDEVIEFLLQSNDEIDHRYAEDIIGLVCDN